MHVGHHTLFIEIVGVEKFLACVRNYFKEGLETITFILGLAIIQNCISNLLKR